MLLIQRILSCATFTTGLHAGLVVSCLSTHVLNACVYEPFELEFTWRILHPVLL